MRHSRPLKILARGFTLIELLVVVIILAILAAIVVPQFSSASSDTKEAALDTNLSALRSAIELYKLQHSAFPGGVATNGGTCPTGATKGSATAAGQQAFQDHLLMYSDLAGNTCSIGDGTFRFGPYLKKGLPADPFKEVSAVVVTSAGTKLTPAVTTGGWAYDSKSGEIVMNSNEKDGRGKELYTH